MFGYSLGWEKCLLDSPDCTDKDLNPIATAEASAQVWYALCHLRHLERKHLWVGKFPSLSLKHLCSNEHTTFDQMKNKEKWCFFCWKTPIGTLHCPMLCHSESGGCDSPMTQHFASWILSCICNNFFSFPLPLAPLSKSSSRQVAFLHCACLLRLGAKQVPGSVCSWYGVTQSNTKSLIKGMGLDSQKKGG